MLLVIISTTVLTVTVPRITDVTLSAITHLVTLPPTTHSACSSTSRIVSSKKHNLLSLRCHRLVSSNKYNHLTRQRHVVSSNKRHRVTADKQAKRAPTRDTFDPRSRLGSALKDTIAPPYSPIVSRLGSGYLLDKDLLFHPRSALGSRGQCACDGVYARISKRVPLIAVSPMSLTCFLRLIRARDNAPVKVPTP